MNSFKVNIQKSSNGYGLGSVRVECGDRADAPALAIKKMVRNAKAYNAKYSTQGLPEWAYRSEKHEDYVAGTVRKVAAKKVAA